jgi:hypothetical protein
MKKIVICAMLLIIAAPVFSQLTNSTPILTKQDYLKKSKTQKAFAWILAGSGVVLTVVGVATLNLNDLGNSLGGNNSGVNSSSTLFVIGGITALSSIPLFIAGHRNKKKAMSLSFKNEKMQQLNKNRFVYTPVPSLSLTIRL